MRPLEMFAHWERVRGELEATIDAFEERELQYAPFPGAWTVGETIAHIADAEAGWIGHVATGELDQWPTEHRAEADATRADLKQMLADVHARTRAFLAGLDEADLATVVEASWGGRFPIGWIIWHVLEHEIHHRGELSLVLGLLGREGLDV